MFNIIAGIEGWR